MRETMCVAQTAKRNMYSILVLCPRGGQPRVPGAWAHVPAFPFLAVFSLAVGNLVPPRNASLPHMSVVIVSNHSAAAKSDHD
jgi:hypothetical protein